MRPLLATLVLLTSAGCPAWEVVECLDGDICSDGSACPPDGFCGYDHFADDGGDGAVNPLCPGGVVEGDFTIRYSADVAALAGCTGIRGGLIVRAQDFTELDLPDIRSLGGLSVAETASLTTLRLAALESVFGLVSVQQNVALTELSLPSLADVGALRFAYNGASHHLALPLLSSVAGDFDVVGNARLTSVDLGRLGFVPGRFRIGYTGTTLRRLELPGLMGVGSLELDGNQGLEDLSLPRLAGTDGIVFIDSNVALRQFELPALGTIGGALFLGGNPELTGLALPALNELGGDLGIQRNARLPTCDAEAIRDQLRAGGWRGVATIESNNDAGTCR